MIPVVSDERPSLRHRLLNPFYADVVSGLSLPRKTLPCKYFYDRRGSQLFERICETDEYYLTRTELAIMIKHAGAMSDALGPGCLLIEPGVGNGRKTEVLLEKLVHPAAYIPIDISREHLHTAAGRMAEQFPGLEILPVCADFLGEVMLAAPRQAASRRVVYFPGSTIGNLEPRDASRFLARQATLCGKEGAILIGVDLKKDPETLERAYNDQDGLTAKFNLNLLVRLNRELGADFRLNRFCHQAFYNPELRRVEMHLVSLARQSVRIGELTFGFAAGETIHTESCYKYGLEEFRRLARTAGLRVEKVWTDDASLFSVQYLTVQQKDHH